MSTVRRRLHRVAAWALVGLVVAACALLLPTSPATAAESGGGCSSNPNDPRPGPYFLTRDYRDGGHQYCGYSSQYSWMSAAKDADVAGIHNTGTYESIEIQDASPAAGSAPGTEVAAQFHQGCPHRSANGLCAVTISIVHQGSKSAVWSEGYKVHCGGQAPPTSSGAEYDRWGAFFEDVGETERGNLAGAAIDSPSGNIVGDLRC